MRTVSFGTSRSAEEVSILRRFGMLPFLVFEKRGGKASAEGEGEGDISQSILFELLLLGTEGLLVVGGRRRVLGEGWADDKDGTEEEEAESSEDESEEEAVLTGSLEEDKEEWEEREARVSI